LAASEHAGSDQRTKVIQTVLTKTKSGYRLSGEKPRVSNAPIADFAIVVCRLDDTSSPEGRYSFALVDLEQEGVTRTKISPLMGLRGMPWGKLTFDNVELCESNVFQDIELEKLIQAIDWGLLIQSFSSLGLAQTALDACIEFAKHHEAYDHPIANLQSVQSRIANMYMDIEAARLLNNKVVSIMAQDKGAAQEVRIAKIHTTEMAVRCADAAMRIFAGRGYSTEFEIERIYRDTLGNIPGGMTPDRLRELMICLELDVDPWSYDAPDWKAANAVMAF